MVTIYRKPCSSHVLKSDRLSRQVLEVALHLLVGGGGAEGMCLKKMVPS